MENAFGVLMLGVVTGLQYALLGVGMVLVYKAARFVNFAHGQLGVIAAVLVAKLAAENHWPYFLAIPVALLAAAGVGALVERTVVQRLFNASRLVLLVATIGVAQILFVVTLVGPLKVDQSVIQREGFPVPFQGQWKIGAVVVQSSQLLTLVMAPLIAFGLYLFFNRTSIGKAIRAAASNAEAARLAGISVRKVSLLVWITAGVLSGLTAILLAPSQSSLDIASLGPSLLLRGLAAALLGGMVELPTAFIAGIGLGVIEQAAYWNVPRGGTQDIVVLVLILVAILARGRKLAATSRRGDDLLTVARSRPPLPARLRTSHIARNLDRYGWGLFLAFGVVFPLLPGLGSESQALLLTLMVAYAIVGVSLTMLTGWAGQASLGHFAFLGVGAYAASRADGAGWALPAVLLVSGLVAAGVAVVVGLPALRFRGLFLGVSTLAFALAARTWLFDQSWIGGVGGIATIEHTRLPIVGPVDDLRAIYYIALAILALTVVGLRGLKVSGQGRALIAVRDNERAASSYGLSPSLTKIQALALSGFLTGMAGALWAVAQTSWTAQAFEPAMSLVMLSLVIVGGLGTLHGPILGALAVFAWPYLVPEANTFTVRAFSSGALLLFILLFVPEGLASLVERVRTRIVGLLGRVGGGAEEEAPAPAPADLLELVAREGADGRVANGADGRVPARKRSDNPLRALEVRITFGGVTALDGVALQVGEWEIVGLIGGNGAGKTTFFNCVSGHLRPRGGWVRIYGRDVTGARPQIRPELGVARSFQDAHLYPGLTVLETVLVALDRADRSGVIPSLFWAPWVREAERRKRAEAMQVLTRVGLAERAANLTGELSTGMRRLCDLAAVMATSPRLVLLDEPTAGIAQREVEAFEPLLSSLRDKFACSILIIEHDVPLLMSICDWIYAFESGRLIAEGEPEEVRSNPVVVASYLGTDSAAIERSGGRPSPARAAAPTAARMAPATHARRAPSTKGPSRRKTRSRR